MFDYTLSPEEVCLQLINRDNGSSLQPYQVTFSNPNRLYNHFTDRDTSVTLTAVPGAGYRDSKTVYYNRVTIDDFIEDDQLVLIKNQYTKYSDLVPSINSLLGINLTPADYVDGPLPVFYSPNANGVQVYLYAANNSLVYKDQLTITLKPGIINISASNLVTTLTGFTLSDNLNKSSFQLVLDKLNEVNPQRQFTAENITVNQVQSTTGATNSRAVLSAIPDAGFSGSSPIYYNRIDLAAFEPDGECELVIYDIPNMNDILSAFNSKFNTGLTLADVQSTVFTQTPIGPSGYSYTLKAASTSLVYRGEIKLRLFDAALPASYAFTTKDLNGFTATI